VEDGSVVGARTYLAAESEPYLEPYDWYLALIIAGALEHNLSSDYITTLYQTPYQTDSDHGRESRGLAIEALRASGVIDYMTLLRR
jgi:gamma-glutamylcyclotransferase